MTPRSAGRVQPCDRAQARQRLADARAQLVLAEFSNAASSPDERKAAASCAVLAGIAAGDAACCAVHRERSRSQNHRDAVILIEQIGLDGADAAARHFERLIAIKDESQYGFGELSGKTLTSAQRHAKALVEFAEKALAS